MAQNGGYRQPSNPAPVSGPGAMSQRTDGGPAQQGARYMAGGAYGDGQAMMDLQQSAPMAATRTPQTQGQRAVPRPGAVPVPFSAPTQRPDEPLTEGNPLGPGAGPGALSGGLGTARDASNQDAQRLKAYLPTLEATANQPNVPTSFVRFVHYLRNV